MIQGTEEYETQQKTSTPIVTRKQWQWTRLLGVGSIAELAKKRRWWNSSFFFAHDSLRNAFCYVGDCYRFHLLLHGLHLCFHVLWWYKYGSIPSTCCFTFLRICLFVLHAGWRLLDISLLFLHVCLLFLHISLTFNIILLYFQYTFGCIFYSRAYSKYISADFQHTFGHTFTIYYPDVSTFRLTCSNIWRLFQHVGVCFVHICLLSIHIFVTGT